ncbi:hypothetical protein B0T26DRAFT_680241 [Lasiosphaeria miniovina]|uniref:Uncharacterized protein n=1 Tax=Lasiosphaeria miniovina TaxID=1954250 RepID=A0AA39ZZQ1_9PEZI|nr:uncharacterized protein B0T26DRAFT_680241 [Lasiosphaeria miniovina]KAK0706574.1 hypothetical protein B0T26DRAFT_680241 [Lasiosphaeria miniovina]
MTSKAMRAAAAAAAVDDGTGDGDSSRPPMPNQAESYLFYTMHLAMKSKPEFDWNAIAEMNGFKNAETAKVRYGQIKRKLKMETWTVPASAASGPGSAKRTPASAGSDAKKRKSSAAGSRLSPGKSSKFATPKRGSKVSRALDDEDDGEDDEEDAERASPGTPTPAAPRQYQVPANTNAEPSSKKAKVKHEAITKKEEHVDYSSSVAKEIPQFAPVEDTAAATMPTPTGSSSNSIFIQGNQSHASSNLAARLRVPGSSGRGGVSGPQRKTAASRIKTAASSKHPGAAAFKDMMSADKVAANQAYGATDLGPGFTHTLTAPPYLYNTPAAAGGEHQPIVLDMDDDGSYHPSQRLVQALDHIDYDGNDNSTGRDSGAGWDFDPSGASYSV